jgi:small-conductance mechanosensitive channel
MTGYTMGGVIQALLVIAIVVVLIRIIHGRSPV